MEPEAVVDNKKEVKKLVALSLGPRPKRNKVRKHRPRTKIKEQFFIFKLQIIR
jgi:hypothetical protein